MYKIEFGRKLSCSSCAVRFYDLTRSPAVCPKCGMEQPLPKPRSAPVARASRVRWAAGPAPAADLVVAEAVVGDAAVVEEADDEDEDDIEEADLVDDDDDDEEAVVKVVPED